VRRRPSRRRNPRDQRGQATVEFALVLPALVLAAIAIIQVALVVRD
jgi:Flp pilus assembly protein TadG